MANRPKIILLADGWKGRTLARALKEKGEDCDLWLSEWGTIPPSDTQAIYIGNGEQENKARLIFGDELAGNIWDLSSKNWDRAKSIFSQLKVPFHENGLVRVDTNGATSQEKGARFSVTELEEAMAAEAHGRERPRRFTQILSAESIGGLEFQVTLQTESGPVRVQSPLFVVATEKFSRGAIPWLYDKRLPITLSSFTAPAKKALGAAAVFFNGGADFAIEAGNGLRVGSFRNLWEDRGVGIFDQIDSVTQENVVRYFSNGGWIEGDTSAELNIEGVTCDGLPLIGPLPGLSGVVFACGFGARDACFWFAASDFLAEAITGGFSSIWDRFSTRRLV